MHGFLSCLVLSACLDLTWTLVWGWDAIEGPYCREENRGIRVVDEGISFSQTEERREEKRRGQRELELACSTVRTWYSLVAVLSAFSLALSIPLQAPGKGTGQGGFAFRVSFSFMGLLTQLKTTS